MMFQELITDKIFEQREEILRAFVAKYRLQPEQCVQVVQTKGNKIVWSVRKKTSQRRLKKAGGE